MLASPFSTAERHGLRCLRAIAGSLDFHRQRCLRMERALANVPDGPRRALLLRDLLQARQDEEAAILALRDAAVHTAGLVPPVVP